SSQDPVACMLDGKVQIMTDFLFFFHHLNQFVIYFFRITVQNADPAYSFYAAEFLQKKVKRFLPVQIRAVYRRFLGDDDQLLHSLGSQIFRLSEKLFFRNAPEVPAQRRNNAVSTVFVAALG